MSWETVAWMVFGKGYLMKGALLNLFKNKLSGEGQKARPHRVGLPRWAQTQLDALPQPRAPALFSDQVLAPQQ